MEPNELPPVLNCDECGEEFDTANVQSTKETADGAEWIVATCPHCGENTWHFLRNLPSVHLHFQEM